MGAVTVPLRARRVRHVARACLLPLAALPLALPLGACHRAPNGDAPRGAPDTWVNPLVRQLADPHVFRDADGTYYYTATVPEYDRIELRRARSIQGLGDAPAAVIWRKHAAGAMGAHVWAPEIHRIDGKWYVYFAAGSAESVWDIRMYVLESASDDPLRGPWIEKGEIHTGIDSGRESFALDATTFVHRGTRYLAWAQRERGIRGNSNLYLAAMANPWTIRGTPVRISRPEYAWEQVKYWVNEGPAVLARHGRVFLTYSASATDSSYCMGMLTAADTSDLLDPRSWTKSPVPVFRSSAATGQWGPGHNAFTVDRSGVDVMLYHARDYRDIVGDPLNDPNRHTRAQRIRWRVDGTPDFGVPVADGPAPRE